MSADEAHRARRRQAAREAGRHPVPVSEGRSRNMQAIKRSDTKMEVALRSALHSQGLRFRKDLAVRAAEVRARPDIVFTKARVAVFVDGCFWHSCPQHGRRPTANSDYWSPKLQRNVQRDQEQSRALREDGWLVLRLWEHTPLDEAAAAVTQAVEDRRHADSVGGEDRDAASVRRAKAIK